MKGFCTKSVSVSLSLSLSLSLSTYIKPEPYWNGKFSTGSIKKGSKETYVLRSKIRVKKD
jgi:hypothetical protein